MLLCCSFEARHTFNDVVYLPAGVRGDIEEHEVATGMCAMAESLTSHQYKSYLVELTHRMRPNTDVQLGKYITYNNREKGQRK